MLIWDSPEAINHFIAQRGGNLQPAGSFTALGWADSTGKLVAGVTFFSCNGKNCYMAIAVDGGTFPRPFILAIGRYVVSQLNLKRLTFVIEEGNLRSQNLVRRLGAVHEATLQDAGITGNMLIFALFTDSCELWKKLANGQRFRTSRPRSV